MRVRVCCYLVNVGAASAVSVSTQFSCWDGSTKSVYSKYILTILNIFTKTPSLAIQPSKPRSQIYRHHYWVLPRCRIVGKCIARNLGMRHP